MIGMINSVTGLVSRKIGSTLQNQLCVRTRGIEWIFEVSRMCLSTQPELGSETTVLTYLVHRDDQMYLCGFSGDSERLMFLDLLKVEGIGARQALKILSSISPEGLQRLLEAGDIDGLETLPGLGKRTAQKMVLALKGKLTLDTAVDGQNSALLGGGPYEDIAVALVSMGYDRKSVVETLKRIGPELEAIPAERREQELMRRAILELS